MSSKVKASIIGVTGYTGTEILRILLQHPHVEIKYLVSRQHEGTALQDLFPRLETLTNLKVTNTDYETVANDSDVVFLCLPHMASQDAVQEFLGKTKIIDLSADFRLNDAALFKKFYKEDHKYPDLLDGRFVYGFPEAFKEDIQKADAVANPGCFALLLQTMLWPLKGHIEQAQIFAISGTSGGGRKARDPVEHPYCSQNVKSYLVNNHRHMPEITGSIGLEHEQLDFIPSVGPFLRGIFAHGFVHLSGETTPAPYRDAPFVRVRDEVHMTNVVSTNFCDLSYQPAQQDNCMLVQGALDNLLKGASGTAVHNMNLMFGLTETDGLLFSSPIYP